MSDSARSENFSLNQPCTSTTKKRCCRCETGYQNSKTSRLPLADRARHRPNRQNSVRSSFYSRSISTYSPERTVETRDAIISAFGSSRGQLAKGKPESRSCASTDFVQSAMLDRSSLANRIRAQPHRAIHHSKASTTPFPPQLRLCVPGDNYAAEPVFSDQRERAQRYVAARLFSAHSSTANACSRFTPGNHSRN